MRVTHTTTTDKLITDYDLTTHSLTRIIDSHIHTVYLKHKTSIGDLARISKIDDEAFQLLASLQKKDK